MIICARVMQGLDTTIVNVCLPHIQGSMSAAQDQISWVLTSYIVASAMHGPGGHGALAGLPRRCARCRRRAPARAAADRRLGAKWPTQMPRVAPENRPSVTSATTSPICWRRLQRQFGVR
jgi:hypothetical protein